MMAKPWAAFKWPRKRSVVDMQRRFYLMGSAALGACFVLGAGSAGAQVKGQKANRLKLNGRAGGKLFEGIGVVNGGGATSVLLKDYPEPQRSQILDLLYKPKFGASVSALLVEIPGDGNATQGSMPSHMHRRDDLNYHRGYTWWVMSEARKRNPALSLDAVAWSAPGWIGDHGQYYAKVGTYGESKFFSQDAADYYVRWLEGVRNVYGIELDAIGVRNEKGVSYEFAKALRRTLNQGGFDKVRLHAFDNWPEDKLDFVPDMLADPELGEAIDIIGAHTFYSNWPATAETQAMAAKMGKPIWNTEDHVYKKGFDCTISLVQCFNHNYLHSGATRVVNWYDIAGIYPTQPYPEDPATVLAYEPWSGHYKVREALWGYAHYGQFSEVGWTYLYGGNGHLNQGGSYVTLKSPQDDYSVIIETKDAKAPQQIWLEIGPDLSQKPLCVWHSNEKEQFVRLADITPVDGGITLVLEPNAIYSLSTTRGQQKGSFAQVPSAKAFPFPYRESFDTYRSAEDYGYLPHYTADIAGAFEIANRPDGKGKCLQQVVPVPTISWAPDWKPYTILGDAVWSDYEVSADIWLNAGDTAAVMGRVNHVGTGWGFIPKGYYLELNDQGKCRLIAIRGKKDPKALVGDAEQQAQIQALIAAGRFDGEGGELVLSETTVTGITSGKWHSLSLSFKSSEIIGRVDGKIVLRAEDKLYERGMAGLLAGQEAARVSTPYYDNLTVRAVGARAPKPATHTSHTPLYAGYVRK
ncbi:MAG: hypothetical protein QM645_00580 [Asticcacaulis sp.]